MSGQCARLWQAIQNGSFGEYARGFATLNLVLMIAWPFFGLFAKKLTPVLTFVLLEILGIIMGIIELPYCCSCCEWCEKLKEWLVIFENYFLRGVIYIAFGTTLIAVSHRVDHHEAGWFFGIALPINGILYWIASCRGEVDKDGVKAKRNAESDQESAPNTMGAAGTIDHGLVFGSSGQQAAGATGNSPPTQPPPAAPQSAGDDPRILAAALAATRR